MNTADAAMVDATLAPQWVITVNGRFVPAWQTRARDGSAVYVRRF